MGWGILAALGWGGADVLGAVSTRRIGTVRTALIALGTSGVVIWAVMLLSGEPLSIDLEHLRFLVISGTLAGGAYLTLYRALELGPVAVVSPVVASFAAVTVILSLLFGGEELTALSGIGMLVTLIGVILATTDIHKLREHGLKHLRGGGIPWAVISMIAFGVASYFLGQGSKGAGALPATTYARTVNVLTVGVVALFMLRRLRATPVTGPFRPWAAVGAGMVDICGTLSFAVGTETPGQVGMVTAVSSALVLPPLIAGIALFRECPAPLQYVGVASVVAGLVLLGLAL